MNSTFNSFLGVAQSGRALRLERSCRIGSIPVAQTRHLSRDVSTQTLRIDGGFPPRSIDKVLTRSTAGSILDP